MASRDSIDGKAPASVLWASAFAVVFGLTKAIFAVQMILVTTVLGVAVGPFALLTLNIVDFAIGVLAAGGGFFFVMRRPWAARLMRFGWVPLIFYEVGRALGLASAGVGAVADANDLIVSLALLVLLISAGICASSYASEIYVRSREDARPLS